MGKRIPIKIQIIIYYSLISSVWFLVFNVNETEYEIPALLMHMKNDLGFVFASTILLYIGISFILNKQERLEAKLAGEQKHSQHLLEQIPLIMWTTDCQLNVIHAGGSGLNFLPHDTDRYLRSLAQPFLDSPDVSGAQQLALEGFETNCNVSFAEHIFDVRVTPFRSHDGKIKGCIGVAVDLTETILTQQSLLKSEARFRSFVSSMDDVVFTLDTEQRHTGVYGRWVEADGLSPDVFIGKTSREILGDDAPAIHEISNERALQGQTVIYNWHTGEEENTKYYQTRLSPIYDGRGTVTGLVGVGRDITDLKRAEGQLESYRRELETRVKQRTDELQQEVLERTRLQKEEYKQRQIAEALRDMALMLTKSLDVDTILDHAMDQIRQVSRFDGVTIMMMDKGLVTMIRARYQKQEAMSYETSFAPQEVPFLRDMIQDNSSHMLSDFVMPEGHPLGGHHKWVQSAIGSPLMINEELQGFVILASEQKHFFRPVDVETLRFFAIHVAAAIQSTRLHQQAQHIAIEDERRRIARDLHDAVTQTLFSANMVSETLMTMLPDKSDRIYSGLMKLRHLTRGALAEMRSLLLELRPQAIEKTNFVTLAQQLADAFYGRTSIPVELSADPLPLITVADVKLNIYRILQETLNNIDKHARAERVCIYLKWDGEVLSMYVEDDGIGFDIGLIETGMGLRIIGERAKSIGAGFEVTSHLSQGATICLRIEGDKLYDTHSHRG